MDWTVKGYAEANHNPVVVVNGQKGTAPIEIAATVGQPVVLDASGTTDPDGNELRFSWFHYPEAGTAAAPQAQLRIDGADTARPTVTPTAASRGRGGASAGPPARVRRGAHHPGRHGQRVARLTSYRG